MGTKRQESRKMLERINGYRKDFVFENYTRLVWNFQDYEKITRKKMIKEVYEIYDEPQNILELCTPRELKYLKRVLEGKVHKTRITLDKDLEYEQESWERLTLARKFLIVNDIDGIFVPDEIKDKVKTALKEANWERLEKQVEINEFILGLAKIEGTIPVRTLAMIVAQLTDSNFENAMEYVMVDRMVNYYLYFYDGERDSSGQEVSMAVYEDYYDLREEVDHRRKKYKITELPDVNLKELQNIFYYDFDIDNEKVRALVDWFDNDSIVEFMTRDFIREAAVLNLDREEVRDYIESRIDRSMRIMDESDLESFLEIVDEALDEMPSAVLNGLTPKQEKEFRKREKKVQERVKREHVKQQGACLDRWDAKLFYKIYFGLLDFTNRKYQIQPGFRIFRRIGLDPTEVMKFAEKFWEEKDEVIPEFCEQNPFDFSEDEIEIVRGFEKGLRDMFVIVKYEKEYTAFLHGEDLYMVKGINDDIDNIISYRKLPLPVRTAIIPFKGRLVYDGILGEYSVSFGPGFSEVLARDYDKLKKVYSI